jgi:hypothetical protein
MPQKASIFNMLVIFLLDKNRASAAQTDNEPLLCLKRVIMSSKASLFKETDIKRSIRGTRAAGLDIGHVEIGKDGKIRIYPKEPAKEPPKKVALAGELQAWD